jgi:hypothetical protein
MPPVGLPLRPKVPFHAGWGFWHWALLIGGGVLALVLLLPMLVASGDLLFWLS